MKFIEHNEFGIRLLQVDTWAEQGIFHGFGGRDFDVRDGVSRWKKKFLDTPLLLLNQRHSKTIIHFHPEGDTVDWEALETQRLVGDAWIVDYREPAVADAVCGIRSADCFPVLIRSTKYPIAAAVHCGWRGAESGLLLDTLVMLGRLGVPSKSVEVAIGPGAQSCCYEVQSDVVELLTRAHSLVESMSLEPLPPVIETREEKTFANIRALLIAQANFFGLKSGQVLSTDVCTICGTDHFSFRREKENTGLQLSFIGYPSLPAVPTRQPETVNSSLSMKD